MPSLADAPVRKKKTPTKTPTPWWGHGEAPHLRWPGITVEIPAVWSKFDRRWESPDGQFYFDPEAADFAEGFFPMFLEHHIGEFDGKPFDLMDYQRLLVVRPLFGWKRASDGLRRFRKVFLAVPKGSGKALSLDTPIPTPAGWTTMGDLQPGHHVFDESGAVVPVLAVTDEMHDRECYRVTFDDGEVIVADADHLWYTDHRRPERRPIEGSIKTTREIAQSLRYSNGQYQSVNHSVPLAGPLDLPDSDLPIEPYTLGVWLGDGDSDCARVTMGEQDREALCGELALAGTVTGPPRRTHAAARIRIGSSPKGIGRNGYDSVNAVLRRVGLLNNKHIPTAYLRASKDQRLSLVQGLMDTDGSVDADNGGCEFCSTNEHLASGLYELLVSLGIKVTMRESAAVLRGREVGRRWRVQFFPPKDIKVFRLPRKADRQVIRHTRRRLSGQRNIVSCDRCPSVPVKCISVGSKSQMYLAGRSMVPTHNSPFGAGLGLFGAFFDGEAGSEVYAVAADRKQAGIVFDSAKVMTQRNEYLDARCEIFRDSIKLKGSTESFQVLSSDASTKHGFRPHFIIFDEFHAQPSRDLYETLYRGMGKRRQPVLVMITTAGDDDESICAEEWDYAKRVIGGLDDPAYLPVVFEAKPDEDWSDMATIRRVNPGFGITMKASYFENEIAAALNEPRKRNSFIQLHTNRWTNQATSWLPVEWWDACDEAMLADAELANLACAAGLDLAQKYDLACFAPTFRKPLEQKQVVEVLHEEPTGAVKKLSVELNYKLIVVPFFWIPEETMRQREKEDRVPYSRWVDLGLVTPTEGAIIDYTRIYADIRDKILPRFPRLKEGGIGYDPAFATDLATKLRDLLGFNIAEVLQNYSHLSEPSQIFEALIKAHRVIHGGHQALRNHVENVTVKTDDAGRIRPVKPKKAGGKKRVDGVVASIMGLKQLATIPDVPTEPTMFFLGARR